jgi:hypothetical protein
MSSSISKIASELELREAQGKCAGNLNRISNFSLELELRELLG